MTEEKKTEEAEPTKPAPTKKKATKKKTSKKVEKQEVKTEGPKKEPEPQTDEPEVASHEIVVSALERRVERLNHKIEQIGAYLVSREGESVLAGGLRPADSVSEPHMSNRIDQVFSALLKAQKKIKGAKQSGWNPHFKKKYANFGDIWNACVPHLNDAGIAVTQLRSDDANGRWLVTILTHAESGQYIQSRQLIKPEKEDPAKELAAQSYAKRGILAAMAGVSTDDGEDDDVDPRTPKAGTRKSTPVPKPQSPAQPKDPYANLSVEELATRIEAGMTAVGIDQSMKDLALQVFEKDKKNLLLWLTGIYQKKYTLEQFQNEVNRRLG